MMASTKPTTTADTASDVQKSATPASDPAASSNEPVISRESKPVEPAEKPKAKHSKSVEPDNTPHPTQAELDAMKEGRFHRDDRQISADDDHVGYRTR